VIAIPQPISRRDVEGLAMKWTTVGLLLLSSLRASAQPGEEPPAAGPVAALHKALEEAGSYRKGAGHLLKPVEAVRQPGDLWRALLLPGWGYDGVSDPDAKDNPAWEALASRLEKTLRRRLQEGKAGQCHAALALLGEIVPELEQRERQGRLREGPEPGRWVWRSAVERFPLRLVADVQLLAAESKDPELRAAAALTLARIDPTTAKTLEVLTKLLSGEEVSERRAATEGLGLVVRHSGNIGAGPATPRVRPGFLPGGLVLSKESQQALAKVAALAGMALGDADAQVRLGCLAVLRVVGETASPEIPTWFRGVGSGFPPPGDRPSPDDGLRRQIEALLAVAEALNSQAGAMGRALASDDPETCIAACRAVEAVATARRRLLRAADIAGMKIKDPLPELPRQAKAVAEGLSNKETAVRLATLSALEALGEGDMVAEAVLRAMEDRDPFVRWGASNVLRSLGPVAADKSVPAAAKLLDDDAPNVRLAAIKVLEGYGPASAAAVEKLSALAEKGEPRVRLAAVRTLGAIGKAANPGAVPSLLTALADGSDPALREAAARALGRIGAEGRGVEKGLRQALSDKHAPVRQAAADALLAEK
jgi:HEAT repeat protein